jgi:hypothetical protein
MPPKDDQHRVDLQQAHPSSPTSPASFFLQIQGSSSGSERAQQQEQQQPEDDSTHSEQQQQQQPQLELEPSPTSTTPVEAVKLPSFRLLPRNPSPEPEAPKEVPAFLAFLNKLHGGDSSQESSSEDEEEPSSTASQFGSSSSESGSETSRHVHFADDLVQEHTTLNRAEYTFKERSNTWYSDRYLRVSSQMHAMEDKNDDDEDSHSAGHKRDLMLAAARIRRARQAVLKEQSRTPYLSPVAKRQKEERIRDAYHRVTLQCERDAKGRGEHAARVAARIR